MHTLKANHFTLKAFLYGGHIKIDEKTNGGR